MQEIWTSSRNQRGYNTTTDNVNKLCAFFDCRTEELAEDIPDDKVGDDLV